MNESELPYLWESYVSTRLREPRQPLLRLPADRVLSAFDPARRATPVAVPQPGGSLHIDIRLRGDRGTVFFGA